MIRTAAGRRVATATAQGGSVLALLAAAGYLLLRLEAGLARRSIGEPDGEAPRADGVWGPATGVPLQLVVLGDSSAAGLGVTLPRETPGAIVAANLAEATGRPVRLSTEAAVGARSADLLTQLDRALAGPLPGPDVAVIMIGTNDVTGRVPAGESVRYLSAAVRRLRAAGAVVVVGTCPDLGTIKPIAQPLRLYARHLSRRLAASQTVAVVQAGGRTVSLGDLLGREFAARAELFSPDRFHPSAAGYAAAAGVLAPSVIAMLSGHEESPDGASVHEESPDGASPDGRPRAAGPVRAVAAQAASHPGTEVGGMPVGGQEGGSRGRWALLLHRAQATPAARNLAGWTPPASPGPPPAPPWGR